MESIRSQQQLTIDKTLNDLLEILSALDGRVRRLELKLPKRKQTSYLKLVSETTELAITLNEEQRKIKSYKDEGYNGQDDFKILQIEKSLEIMTKVIVNITKRVEQLEK